MCSRPTRVCCGISAHVFVVSAMGLLVGMTTPYWSDDPPHHEGIWQTCETMQKQGDDCRPYWDNDGSIDGVPGWRIVTWVSSCLSMLMVFCAVCLCCFLNVVGLFQIVAGLSGIVTVLTFNDGQAVRTVDKQENLWWSYYLTVAASVVLLVNGGIVSILAVIKGYCRCEVFTPCGSDPERGNKEVKNEVKKDRRRNRLDDPRGPGMESQTGYEIEEGSTLQASTSKKRSRLEVVAEHQSHPDGANGDVTQREEIPLDHIDREKEKEEDFVHEEVTREPSTVIEDNPAYENYPQDVQDSTIEKRSGIAHPQEVDEDSLQQETSNLSANDINDNIHQPESSQGNISPNEPKTDDDKSTSSITPGDNEKATVF